MNRDKVVVIIYTSLCAIGLLALLLLYGLLFQHSATLAILNTIKNVLLIVFFIILAGIIMVKSASYFHTQRMKQEEYLRAKQERDKVKRETDLLHLDALVKRQEIELKKAQTAATAFDIVAAQQRLAMEVESMRVRLGIEQQQASIYKVGISEHVFSVKGSDFTQLVQGQLPQRAGIQQRNNNEPLQIASPHAPTFAQMHRMIVSEDHLVLGYTDKEPVVGTLEDHLLSMLSTGRPKTGKSTGLLYYAAMFLKVGVLPIILDPQGSLQELEGIVPYRNSMKSIHAFLPMIYKDMEEREELWRNGRMLKPYSLVVIIDELPLIAAWEEKNLSKDDVTVMDLIQKVILEMRKMHVYVIVAGQGFPAYIMPTLSRDNTSSRLIFPTSERFASMAGLEDKYRKTMLPIIEKSDRGTAIIDVSCMKEPLIIDIPFTTVQDLVNIIDGNEVYAQLIHRFADTTIVDSNWRSIHDTPAYEQKAITSIQDIQIKRKDSTRQVTLDDAIQAWNGGATGARELERALHIPYNQALKFYHQIEDMIQEQQASNR